jgi:hypothetical protein
MIDAMRFEPDRLDVRQGETVRFVVRNTGKVMHEFVIGTAQELAKHAALMKQFPNMEHDEPYMAHVAPREDRHDRLDVQSRGRIRLRLPAARALRCRQDPDCRTASGDRCSIIPPPACALRGGRRPMTHCRGCRP